MARLNENLTSIMGNPYDSSHDEYEKLVELIKHRYFTLQGEQMYYIDKPHQPLYNTFMIFLPEDAKQHYNCNTCRHFINKYGRLVYIDNNNEYQIKSVLFGFTDEDIESIIPEKFRNSIRFMRNVVQETGEIICPFVPKRGERYGYNEKGGFDHFNFMYTGPVNILSDINELTLKYQCLTNGISVYNKEVCEQVQSLMTSEVLNRSAKFSHYINDFTTILTEVEKIKNSKNRNNAIWYFSNSAVLEVCNIKNTPVGLLMYRLMGVGNPFNPDMTVQDAINEFNKVVAPDRYQRPTTAPSMQNVIEAEKYFKENGLEDSLKRRFCTIEDIPEDKFIWKPTSHDKKTPELEIFKDVANSIKKPVNHKWSPIAGGVMAVTLNKFLKIIKEKNIEKIGYSVNPMGNHICALCTEAIPGSKPIIRWDTEEERNPLSWYIYQQSKHSNLWNMNVGDFVEVTGIIPSPNRFSKHDPLAVEGIIFLLKDAYDKMPNGGSGLFPEIINPELHKYRRTIEAYSNNNPIANIENGTSTTAAAGVFFSNSPNAIYDNIFIVDDGKISVKYKITLFE